MKPVVRGLLFFLGALAIAIGTMMAALAGACVAMFKGSLDLLWIPLLIGAVPAGGGVAVILCAVLLDRSGGDTDKVRLGRGLTIAGVIVAVTAFVSAICAAIIESQGTVGSTADILLIVTVFGVVTAIVGRTILVSAVRAERRRKEAEGSPHG